MNRYLGACLFVVCTAASLPAAPSLQEARQRWLHGNYAEAREQYEKLLEDARTREAAAVGLSRALQSEGEYDRALEVVETALKDSPRSADLLARRAEVLHLRGRWDDAEKAAEAALAIRPDHFLARWVRAQVYRDRGDLKKADAECRWFVRTYSDRENADKPIKDPDELLLVGLAGTENARWHSLSDQFKFIVEELYNDVLKIEPAFWLADYQAGLLLQEKYNLGEAIDSFDKALKTNPSAAEALAGKGSIALGKFEMKDAERFAEQALNINPKLPEALRLRADVHLALGDPAAALRELETARKVNPRDEYTLARVAACLQMQKKKDEAEAIAAEVARFNPKPAVFYDELGERLEERRHYDEAEKCFRKAAEMRPNMPEPLNSLGQLFMRMGREKEAREMLDRGFKADPFNVRVNNLRKVLHHLDKYDTLQTEHFELRFDPKHDKVFANWIAGYLENIHADLSKQFKHAPKERILIEVFHTHEMFSGRVVALPDLHTIGACTGRMFAMVSPRGTRNGGRMPPFNWNRVLRHEMVHVFNLEQTNFLVPHWLTEGLAVSNEGFPRPPSWNELLLERVPAGKVMNLDNIDLGFIRPQSQADWHMAYCQSQLYVEHLRAKYGPDSIGELLAAYHEGLDTAAALERVCKVDKAAFEKGYRAYLDEVIKPLRRGKPAEKRRTTAELKKAYEKENDLEAAAELALRLLPTNRVEARRLAELVLERKKSHPKATYVMARLARAAGDLKQERSLLEGCVDRESPDPRVLRELGKIYYDAKEFDKAADIFELGRKAEPFDNNWLVELARVYAQSGNKEKQIAVLQDLVPTDADDLDARLRVARLLLDTGRHAEAEKYARQALEIDVLSEEGRDVLLKALQGQKKDEEAARVQKLLGG
jgi:tetratricopeptide (TPR) repeat protein